MIPDEVVHANRWLVTAAGRAAASLANRGRPNPNTASSGNPDAVRLGAEIGGHGGVGGVHYHVHH